jgi:MFS family permease
MLWHREFWLVAFAELLLSASVYIFITALPLGLQALGARSTSIGIVFLTYAVGLYVLGPLVYHLTQRFRRNRVCEFGILSLVVIAGVLYFFPRILSWVPFYAISFLVGVGMGLSQMVLLSTLVIDKTESFQRTEANYIVSWFNRLALAIGPLLGIFLQRQLTLNQVSLIASCVALVAFFLIAVVAFPFKAPDDEQSLFSCDRFFLKRGFPLFFNLLILTFATGLLLYGVFSLHFFILLLAGFLFAILAEKYVFVNAELKSEAVAGCVLLILAALLRITRVEEVALLASAFLTGMGIGILASRFLLFFIKLSKHCERGTSQSSFFLSWETGLALGLTVGYVLNEAQLCYEIALGTVFIALIVYNALVHPWYLKHKNR